MNTARWALRMSDMRLNRPAVWSVVAIAIASALGYRMLGINLGQVSDEVFHALQVRTLASGSFEVLDSITMIPTYHALLALVARAAGNQSLELLRFVTLVGSFTMPLLMWRLARTMGPEVSALRTVQWFIAPLVFPFCFLIYTDIWALSAVLATVLFVLANRLIPAALAGLLAVVLRQDMVIWVAFAWVLAMLHDGAPLRLRAVDWTAIVRRAIATAPLLCVLGLFVLFVVWNRGVAVGERGRHEVIFNLTNVFFFLQCSWLLFLPQNLEAAPRIVPLLRKRACLAGLAIGFVLYMILFSNRHIYNGPSLNFWIHNEALYWLTYFPVVRGLAFLPMAWMVLTACVTRFSDRRLYLLYPFALLSAGAHPLIEPRYYLTAMALFQVWRPALGVRWEALMFALYAVATPVVVWGIAYKKFFL